MRTTIIRLMAIFAVVCSSLLGTAMVAAENDDALDDDTLEQSYVKAYTTPQSDTASPESTTFIMFVAVLDMVDEDAAIEEMESMLSSFEADDDFSDFDTKDLEGIGDEAVHYTAIIEGSDTTQSGTAARQGDVLVFVMMLGENQDESFAGDVTKHILDTGASDTEVSRDETSGGLTGGLGGCIPDRRRLSSTGRHGWQPGV